MIFDEAHFITVSLSTRLRAQDICGGACDETSCDERRSSSLSGRTMWRSLRLVMELSDTERAYLRLLRVPSDLIYDYRGRNFARNPTPISPRNTRAVSAFALRLRLAVARLLRGSKFYAKNRKISRLNVVAEIFQKIYP